VQKGFISLTNNGIETVRERERGNKQKAAPIKGPHHSGPKGKTGRLSSSAEGGKKKGMSGDTANETSLQKRRGLGGATTERQIRRNNSKEEVKNARQGGKQMTSSRRVPSDQRRKKKTVDSEKWRPRAVRTK